MSVCLSVCLSHSPTQPMHEMYDETTDRPSHRELIPLLFSHNMLNRLDCKTVVFGRFRKAGSAVSVILECEAREPHTPAVFSLAPDLPFEYVPSLALAKNSLFCSL